MAYDPVKSNLWRENSIRTYTFREFQELSKRFPELGYTVQRTKAGQIRFYELNAAGKKRQISRNTVQDRNRFILEKVRLRTEMSRKYDAWISACAILDKYPHLGIEAILGAEEVEYYQNKGGEQPKRVLGTYVTHAVSAWQRYERLSTGKRSLKELEEVVQLAETYFPKNIITRTQRLFSQAYREASLGDFYGLEGNIPDFEEQSLLEFELRIDRGVDEEDTTGGSVILPVFAKGVA